MTKFIWVGEKLVNVNFIVAVTEDDDGCVTVHLSRTFNHDDGSEKRFIYDGTIYDFPEYLKSAGVDVFEEN